ncbi:GGDEF domain-containing protein [Dasania sp. GY-MA-18]|uniref:diguanylate cyclase n=1 Tax=Dasania phycosphaerae TaxID=2950436 RepID=A0A9J6RHN0_9GAMM|nr:MULTISPECIES: GGDEF domain-containing protein [Dasania]MCR8921283.1 GGDEF domain-containing protein [Dasania sp. GY-MA-18]MCZ0863711.1 GGDEF domain-containing protein [Dasania phycosphaerae]MCZ0867439.1 GGDEF domain-containing protein [Dasania phycosphaerae]
MADCEDEYFEDLIQLGEEKLSVNLIQNIADKKSAANKLEAKYGTDLYVSILLSLTHETFQPEQAKKLWQAINEHYQQLNKLLARDVHIAVAAMDYLSNINPQLESPIIISQQKSTFITNTSTTDELTGLYTREVFDVNLAKELELAKRTPHTVCLLMIDIDDFKQVNDNHGHQAGDQVLATVGQLILASVRSMDIAARYGGEEIVIIMPAIEPSAANLAANRIRANIANTQIQGINVTVSIGVAALNKTITSSSAMIKAADLALYKAKHSGKNCVVSS